MSQYPRKILACPMVTVHQGRITAFIDQDLTRRLLLYWDQLVFLSHNHAELSLSGDHEFLKSTQVLDVVRFKLDWDRPKNLPLVEAEFAYDAGLVKGFSVMSGKDPAIWSYHQPPWKPSPRMLNIGPLLELKLYDLLPVPGENVPYNDILEFKLKRKDELNQLRFAIDELIEEIQRAQDTLRAEDRAVADVKAALNDLRRVADESIITRLIRALKVSVNLPAVAGGAVAATQILPAMTSLPPSLAAGVGAVAAVISVEAVLGKRRNSLPDGAQAFNYAAEAEQELAR